MRTPTAAAGLVLLATLLSAASCGEEPLGYAADPNAWELVWSDEFEGPAGQLPDPSKWGFDIGTDWGNGQLEWTTDRPANVSLDGAGNLAITARRESWEGQPYTSGRIQTKDRFEREGGRFAARIRLPVGRGIWPAFWMLGDNLATAGWPAAGEIDIMEHIGKFPAIAYGTVHGPGYSGSQGIGGSLTLPGGAKFADDFHVFACEWEPQELRFYVDGQLYHTVTPADLPAGKAWVFDDQPFFIILNLAVGGAWPGYPDSTTVFPQFLHVDYVRVYQKAP